MNRGLDDQLCRDFPEIFRDRLADPRTTAICFGLECGDGWEPLIRSLCERLMWEVTDLRSRIKHHESQLACTDRSKWNEWQHEHYTEPNLAELKQQLAQELERVPVAVQVKEKFGTLRFYVNGASDQHWAAIEFAEMLSGRICEQCGAMKNVRLYTLGWHRTLCEQHADENYGEQARLFRDTPAP